MKKAVNTVVNTARKAVNTVTNIGKSIEKGFEGVDGLDEVVDEIMGLEDSEIYWKFFLTLKGVDWEELKKA